MTVQEPTRQPLRRYVQRKRLRVTEASSCIETISSSMSASETSALTPERRQVDLFCKSARCSAHALGFRKRRRYIVRELSSFDVIDLLAVLASPTTWLPRPLFSRLPRPPPTLRSHPVPNPRIHLQLPVATMVLGRSPLFSERLASISLPLNTCI